MTKFFIPVPRGAPKSFAHPPKKKKGGSCVVTLQKRVFQVLKKLLTRQIQKTIRKLHEQSDESEKAKLLTRLGEYKKVGKPELKQLSYFIMREQLNVEADSIKKNFKITPITDAEQLPEQIRGLYQTIKGKNLYKEEIDDVQKIRNTVSEKKKIKKEKAKSKKKAKVAVRKEKKQQGEAIEEKEKEKNSEQKQDIQQQISEQRGAISNENESNECSVNKNNSEKQFVNKKEEPKKNLKTEFKKTGRNKFLQQKRNQKKGFNRQETRKQSLQQKKVLDPLPGRHQTPHPSWQAKRQIKNQIFLQPFEGKRILL